MQIPCTPFRGALLAAALFSALAGPTSAQRLELPDKPRVPDPTPKKEVRRGAGRGPSLELPRPGQDDKKKGSGGLELPSGRKAQQPKAQKPAPQPPRTQPGLGKGAYALFLETLRSREDISREELIAEYALLGDTEKQRLMQSVGTLPSLSLARLSLIYAYLPKPEALGLLLRALRTRSLGRETEQIAENAVRLAGDRAKHLAFDFLGSRRRLVRLAGERILLRHIRVEDLPELRRLFESASSGTRLSAIRVFGEWIRNHEEASLDGLIEALDAKDGSLRRAAAQILMTLDPSRAVPALEKRAQQPAASGPKRNGFLLASLLLARLELVRGEAMLPEEAKPFLIATRQSGRPLERAVGAIVGGVGRLLHPRAIGRSTLERAEVNRLMEDLLGVVKVDAFYEELSICHGEALLVLRLLSGEDFGNDRLRWDIWWREVKEEFRPMARSVELTPELAKHARLVLSEGGEAKFSLLGPEADEGAADGVRFRLEAEEFATLTRAMQKRGFLDLAARLQTSKVQGERLRMTLTTSGLRAQDAFRTAEDLRFVAIHALLQELFQREAWQEFAPRSLTAKERRVWWSEQERIFASLEGPRAKSAHTLQLCAAVLDELAEEPRRRALGLLLEEAAQRDSRLGDVHADSLLALVQDSESLPAVERRTIFEILAQIRVPGLFPKLLLRLRRQPVAEIRPILASVLSLAGPEHIRAALRDEDSIVRAAAVAEMGNLRDARLYPTLIELLQDESSLVRRRAIQSVGRLGLREALPVLGRIATGDQVDERRNALVAMGAIGGPGVYEALFDATTRMELADKLAAVRGLTVLRDARTGGALLRIATAYYPQPLGLLAFEGLEKRGGPELRGMVRDAFFKTSDRALKQELVFSLAAMGEPEVFKPLLDQLSRTGRYRDRTLLHLASISGVDWTRQADAVVRYRQWFEAEGKGKPRDWFLQALLRDEVQTRLTAAQLLPGASPEVIDEVAGYLENAKSWPVRMLANFLLREITRQDYGSITPGSPLGERQAIADRFRAFARAQAKEGR